MTIWKNRQNLVLGGNVNGLEYQELFLSLGYKYLDTESLWLWARLVLARVVIIKTFPLILIFHKLIVKTKNHHSLMNNCLCCPVNLKRLSNPRYFDIKILWPFTFSLWWLPESIILCFLVLINTNSWMLSDLRFMGTSGSIVYLYEYPWKSYSCSLFSFNIKGLMLLSLSPFFMIVGDHFVYLELE